MKALNMAGYVALVVAFTPIQFVLSGLLLLTEILRALILLVTGSINIFLYWVMPDPMKARLMAEALAQKIAAAKKDE